MAKSKIATKTHLCIFWRLMEANGKVTRQDSVGSPREGSFVIFWFVFSS